MRIRITESDLSSFRHALTRYIEETKKDVRYVCQRVALNIVIKAYKLTPFAKAAAIAAVAKQPWWPKFIASRLSRRGRRYTRAQARGYSRAIISRRQRSINYIRSGWIPAMRAFNRGKASARTSAVLAGSEPPGYGYVSQSADIAQAVFSNRTGAAGKVGRAPLRKAFSAAADDMIKYLDERIKKTAAKHSRR